MRLFILVLSVGFCHGLHAEGELTHPWLRMELLRMELEDQHYRLPGQADPDKAQAINRTHVARLKVLVHQYGWPTLSMVGEDGEQAAWIIVQHADTDRSFQREILELITPLVSKGEVSAQTYAYLYDRVNRPQRYGTQGECRAAGEWVPHPIEDPGHIDDRRKAVGLEPLARYIDQASRYLCMAQDP